MTSSLTHPTAGVVGGVLVLPVETVDGAGEGHVHDEEEGHELGDLDQRGGQTHLQFAQQSARTEVVQDAVHCSQRSQTDTCARR